MISIFLLLLPLLFLGGWWLLQGGEEEAGKPPSAGVFMPGKAGHDTEGYDLSCRPLKGEYTEQKCRQQCADNADCVAYNVNGPVGAEWCCKKGADAAKAYGGKPKKVARDDIVWYGKKGHWSS